MNEFRNNLLKSRLSPVVDEVIVLESRDRIVNTEVGPGGQGNETNVQRKAGLLDFADKL